MPQHEYSDPPVIVLRMGEGMINLSAPPDRACHPRAQERMSRVALDTEVLRAVRVATHAIIIGCGGTGWYTAMTLAMSDICGHIILYDGDNIEELNLNRLPVPAGAVGYPKAEVLAAEIVRVRPSQTVSAFNDWFPAQGIVEHLGALLTHSNVSVGGQESIHDYEVGVETGYAMQPHVVEGRDHRFVDTLCLLFDCTDNPVFQNELASAVGEVLDINSAGRVIHTRVSYDGVRHITVKHGTVARILDEQAGRYTMMPSWALPAQLAATLGVYSALRMAVGWNGCPDLSPTASIHNSYGDVLTPTPQEVRSG